MSALPCFNLDRRFSPRTNINSQIKYKLTGDSSFTSGLMLNISQFGLALSLDQKIPENTQLNVLMESDRKDEAPIEIFAEIVRTSKSSNEYAYTYGCIILEVKDF